MGHFLLRIRYTPAMLFLMALSCVAHRADAGQNVDRRIAYSGSRLTGDVFLCSSDQIAAGGYWSDAAKKTTEQGVSMGREKDVITWRITLRKTDAEVVRSSSALQIDEERDIYTKETTPTGGLVLVWRDRPPGWSPQIITIDPTNSSFVYST